MKKKLLILGMGHAQKDLAIAARSYGAEVYAVAKNTEGPARDYVDHCASIDIIDIDSVCEYAKEQGIDAVYTLGLEAATIPVAQISERLGLPSFVSEETIKGFASKVVWREKLGSVAGNIPFTSGYTLEDMDSWKIFPAILKPADGSGQRGVVRVDSAKDIEEKFEWSQSFSKSGLMILEKYVSGDEISVNTFLQKGELKFYAMSDRISHKDLPGGIIKEHHIPSKYETPEIETAVVQLVKDVNRAMGFTDGHIYFQMKIEDGKPYIIEFTPRFDACHMWRLIRESYGLDLLQVTLESLFEGHSDTLDSYEKKNLHGKHYTLRFHSAKPGTIVSYDSFNVAKKPSYLYWYYQEGETVRSVTGIIEKVGYEIRRDF